MSSKRLRLPFVVTIATASACGGTAIIDGNNGSGGSSSSSSGSGTTNGSGTSSGVSTGSGNTIICPADPPSGYQQCDPGPGSCSYDISCQSGLVTLTFTCADGSWAIGPETCNEIYDSCPGTEYYCNSGGWWMPTETNPPSPCPDLPPSEGEMCFTGGMGGVWENCGYRCSDGAWTIATCSPATGTWQYDNACF